MPEDLPPLDATEESAEDADDPEFVPVEARPWPRIWMGPFLHAMATMPAISQAALRVGVDRGTVHRAMQRHEEFALAVDAQRNVALDALESALYLRATIGTPVVKTVRKSDRDGNLVEETVTEDRHISDVLGIFYLKRWRPEYRDSFRVESTGANGGAIQVSVVEEAAADFDSRIAALEARQAATSLDG